MGERPGIDEAGPLPPSGEAPFSARPVEPAALARPISPLEMPLLTRRQAALDFGLVAIVGVAFPFLPGLVIWLFQRDAELAPMDVGLLTLQKWGSALLALILAGYLVLRNGVPAASLGLRADQLGRQVAWGVFAFAGTMAVHLAVALIVAAVILTTPAGEEEMRQRVEFMTALPKQDVLSTLRLVSGVALHEELLFRGLLLTLARRFLGSWWAAVVLTSATFGVLHFHQGSVAIIQIFCISVSLSVFFIRSRSLLAVILAHFLYDFLMFRLQSLLPDLQEVMEASGAV